MALRAARLNRGPLGVSIRERLAPRFKIASVVSHVQTELFLFLAVGRLKHRLRDRPRPRAARVRAILPVTNPGSTDTQLAAPADFGPLTC